MYKDKEGRVLDFLTQDQWDTLWAAVGPRQRRMELDSLLAKNGYMSFHGPYKSVSFFIKKDDGELFPDTQRMLEDGVIERYTPGPMELMGDLDPDRFKGIDDQFLIASGIDPAKYWEGVAKLA